MEDNIRFAPGEQVELKQEYAVLSIPASTLELTVTAKIYVNGELHSVSTKLDFEEVRDAIKEAKEGYIPSDATFSLTPLGEEIAAKLQSRYSRDYGG